MLNKLIKGYAVIVGICLVYVIYSCYNSHMDFIEFDRLIKYIQGAHYVG